MLLPLFPASHRLLAFAIFLAMPQLAFSAPKILGKESLSLNTKTKTDLTLSVYVLENSSWSQDAVMVRLREMNEALRSCGTEAAFVDYYRVIADFPKVRVDDYDRQDQGDGMQALSALNPGDRNLRLFYFENYLDPFSSGGIFPLAIPENTAGVNSSLRGTAWFPFQTSARRQNRDLPYSEEGHELGHLLMRAGHDDSGVETIMADKSSLRLNRFTADQCKAFQLPSPPKLAPACEALKQKLMPTFTRHFETYNQTHYMTQWCVRNSQNLFHTLMRERLSEAQNVFAVYAINQDEDLSVKPRMARWKTASWSNHAILVVDGLVLDQDFTDGAVILPLADYLEKMWGERAKQMKFQVRPASKIDDYTNYGVRRSFAAREYLVMNLAELRAHFSHTGCAD